MAEVDAMRGVKPWHTCLFLSILILGAANARSPNTALASEPERVEPCSIIDLIANPVRYDGKRIETWGVARMSFEGTAIYFSSESAEHRVRVNGVYLALADSGINEKDRKALDLRWVYVAGTFHAPKPGSVDWRGHIDEIIHLYAPEDVEVER